MSRRLAAILVADVVGYSHLVERDEAGTLALVKQRRKDLIEPLIARHDGRIVKFMGDGVLAEFASAVSAVSAALALQKGSAKANEATPSDRQIVFRVGLALGDIVVDEDDIYGNGVNLAARVQPKAEPGEIFVTQSVVDQVQSNSEASFDALGPRTLKNISVPVTLYKVSSGGGKTLTATPTQQRPSIAVLPFSSAGGEQGIFADGLTEDLISELSRNAKLLVIARQSSFAYRNRAVDAPSAARELGVRYLLDGNARVSDGRVRINVQLVDAIQGTPLWAERFDRDLKDIFTVQDEVVEKIVGALVGRLTPQQPRQHPANLEAYRFCVQARALRDTAPGQEAANREAEFLLREAIRLDPNYSEAHSHLAQTLWGLWAHLQVEPEKNRAEALAMAERAVQLDPNSSLAHRMWAYLLAYEHRWEESDKAFDTGLALSPNMADAFAQRTDLLALAGKTQEALESAQTALRLNPLPPSWYFWQLGFAQYAAGEFNAAVTTLRDERTYRTASRRILAAALAKLGRIEEAKREAQLFLLGSPRFSVATWAAAQPSRSPEVLQAFVDGYRLAGLPE